jgi:hypothetical protein
MKNHYFNHYNKVAESILNRYAMVDRPSSGLKNIVVDSFVPRMMYATELNTDHFSKFNMPKTAVAISPWFANLLGISAINIEQLTRLIGYDRRSLSLMFKKMKQKKKKLILLGYGGTSINTVHWLSEISKMIGIVNLFDKVTVYEPDEVEFSNLLRFPINPSLTTSYPFKSNKMKPARELYSNDIDSIKRDIHKVRKVEIGKDELNSISEKVEYLTQYAGTREIKKICSDTVIFGAPDIPTRTLLSERGNFICATHGDDSCRIDLNPEQTEEIQVESYGVIQLNTFFMNQLRMAISLVEILASDMDLNEKDKNILDYSFSGSDSLITDRAYNFQSDFNGLILTPDEARNIR